MKTCRILCLHGYRQSGDMFRSKLGSLRKVLKRHVEFVFVTAPHRIPLADVLSSTDGENAERVDQFGWWFSEADGTFRSKQHSDVSLGLEDSLRLVEEACRQHAPIHGVLAFSQGASLAGMLCLLQEQKCLNFKFDFAILVAGFVSQCSLHEKYYSGQVSIPTLHVIGETDSVIPKEMSEALMAHFKDPVVLAHPGGHFVPATGELRSAYVAFIEARLQELAVCLSDTSEAEQL
ncbi:esterase OVCA2 isoform X2 [Bacillus rossius redtenbacheri]|uniref:esterase OVCA2 isoform X2 n=1 Tax=Bacillus rossius redtenbacheri TaxID=93214 RepID=UPI002FDE0B8C